jgi:tellurite resistance protein
MNQQRLLELSERVRQLKADASCDCSDLLRAELAASSSLEEKTIIRDMLALELQSQNQFEQAEQIIKERIEMNRELPDGWIRLALHYHYYSNEDEKALSAIDVAVAKARADGNFFRQAHLERIRIALTLRNYPTIQESLAQLVGYQPRGSLDVQLETEFLALIPVGAVSQDYIDQYKQKVADEAAQRR